MGTTATLKSQEEVKNDVGSWMVFSADNQISERFSVPVVGILCYENLTQQTEFGFIRTGLTYRTNSNLKFTLGAAYVDSQPLNHHEFETLTTQFWLYEEAKIKTGKKLAHRIRLEHRWIDKASTDNLFNTRLRYRFELKQKLFAGLYLKCTDEPFFNFNDLKIDQNRLFMGIGREIGKDISFEIGYFKTNLNKTSIDRIRVALHFKTSLFKGNTNNTSALKNRVLSKNN